jgi:hypothetical protein
MHVERFYPTRMSRHWSVTDGVMYETRPDGRTLPHSLWLTKHDANEMSWRLSELWPDEHRYTPLTTHQKERVVWKP